MYQYVMTIRAVTIATLKKLRSKYRNFRFVSKTKHNTAYFVLVPVVYILLRNVIKEPGPIIRHRSYLVSDMSCHYDKNDDALPSAEDPSFAPKSRSIFFHETSCRGGLTSRQACSVEAAARAHPQSEIYVLFSTPVSEFVLKKSSLATLLQLQNVKFARVHIEEYCKGTILEPMLIDLEDTKYPVEHISDMLRILTLHKWGGIYLDTDLLVVRSMDSLPPNWVVRQGFGKITSAIMSFAKDDVGKNVTNEVLKEIYKSYDPYDWPAYGPRIIEKVVLRMCVGVIWSNDCNELKLLDYDMFDPLHYKLWKLLFKPGVIINSEPPYAYHMWHHLSSFEAIEVGSPYDTLAKKYCPSIREMYGEEF